MAEATGDQEGDGMFMQLPEETVKKIFSYLSTADCIALSKVNKILNGIVATDSHLWKKAFTEQRFSEDPAIRKDVEGKKKFQKLNVLVTLNEVNFINGFNH
jgi:hypothetical protein